MARNASSHAWHDQSVAHLGRTLALRIHGPESGVPVLALHGWQDNSATFERLGPLLPSLRLIAIDLPGHGLSDWRGAEGNYCIWSYVDDVRVVAEALKLQRFAMLGHSMGGAVSALFAAVYPERVSRLALLDAVGPLATAAADAPEQLRRALKQAARPGRRTLFPTMKAAIAARAANNLGSSAAAILGRRGIARESRGFRWTLDPRLNHSNPLSLTEEQAEAFLRRIGCPVQLISAPVYWHGKRKDWFERRCTYFAQLQRHELRGGHHQHLEGQVRRVAALLRDFLGAKRD